jgi:hypothetical protein
MENQRDDLILIFAGGKDKIEGFFNSNPGISSRIGNHIDFPNYEIDDLTDITKFLLNNDSRYKFTDETLEILVHYIDQLKDFPAFANARTVKVFVNQLLAYQAIRVEKTLLEKGSIDYESLVTIQPGDFDFFSADDFINIVGSEDVKLFK